MRRRSTKLATRSSNQPTGRLDDIAGRRLGLCRPCPLPVLCRFSDAGNDDANPALRRPAAEKRQGTKSRREVVRRRCRRGAVPQEGYGDLVAGRDFRRFGSAIRLEQGCNLNVPARMLLNGNFTFCPIRDFNGLAGQAAAHSTTSAR